MSKAVKTLSLFECRMRSLTAQATSSLLNFPKETIEALGEDDLPQGSVLWGKISGGSKGLAWLARGPHLEVVNPVTGERLSAYRFCGLHGRTPTVRVVKEFSWWKRLGLLVGVGNALCLYDVEGSRVVKSIALPGRVIAIEPVTNDGGVNASNRYLHPSLRWFTGVAAVATDVGHVLLVDLCLHDFSWSQKKIEILDLDFATASPGEVAQIRETAMRGKRHLCFQLQSCCRRAASTLYFISRTNQLVVGFSNGSLSLWNIGTLTREHNSWLKGGRIPVCAFTFQEPANDPGNSCYLWAVQSTQKSGGDALTLRMLQLTFVKRRRTESGRVMYEMPASLRPESLHDCPYFALWSLDTVTSLASPNLVLDIMVDQTSLAWRGPPSYLAPGETPRVSSCGFDGVCLLSLGVLRMTCTPLRKEEEQLEALLSAAAETGSSELLVGYINRWTAEEQPSAAENLQFVHECAWNRALHAADEFNQICVPLFDGSFIDQETHRSLHQCQFRLYNLSTIFNCLPREAQGICEDLTDKHELAGLNSLYAQMVMWFCRSGLLPEGLDESQRSSRCFYNYRLLQSHCRAQRERLMLLSRGKWDLDGLMIDGMVSHLGKRVEKLWCRGEEPTGKYPPPSLKALLQLYLLEDTVEIDKHAITMYLLLDIGQALPNNTGTLLQSFCRAFAIPQGLVQLIQGFWLLDHNDYENSLPLLYHPATAKTAVWLRQRVIQTLMCQGECRKALTYIRVTKPLITSSREVQLVLSVFLSNRCFVDAWGLLQQHSTDENREELLLHMFETCREMGLVQSFLQLPFKDTELVRLVKILQNSIRIQDYELHPSHHLQRANNIAALQPNESAEVNLTVSVKVVLSAPASVRCC
ncbi:protein ELYS-like [Phaenicophaeus curvirostris]|uniref:protein ELYS-like n=1 Tax=Phaenicophaeus curvirostris TaxID=33595 RepID=UPI0037F098E9